VHARMEKTHTNKKPVNALLSPHQQAKNKSQNTRTQDAHMHPAHRADVRALAGDGGRRSLTDMLEGMPTVRSDANMGAGDLGGDGGAAGGGVGASGVGPGGSRGMMVLAELQSQLCGFASEDQQGVRSSGALPDNQLAHSHRQLPSLVLRLFLFFPCLSRRLSSIPRFVPLPLPPLPSPHCAFPCPSQTRATRAWNAGHGSAALDQISIFAARHQVSLCIPQRRQFVASRRFRRVISKP